MTPFEKSDNLTAPQARSMLSELTQEWQAKGWDLDALRLFRMEGEGAGGGDGGAGASGGTGGAGDGGGSGGAAGAGASKTFTQDDLTRIAAQEKEQGKRATEKAIAELLGMTPEEAKAALDAQKEAKRATMDEATRLKAEAEDARKAAEKDKADGETAKAEAAKVKREALIERALVRAGLTDDDDGTALAYALRMVEPDVPADADLAKTLEIVNKAKEKFPALFGGAATYTPPGGVPAGGPPRKPPANQGTIAAARERARAEREASNHSGGNPFGSLQPLGS